MHHLRHRLLVVAALLPLWTALGCNNPCQALCQEIADFSKRECGLEFPQAEVDQCVADHASGNLAEGEKAVCRDGRGNVEEEWDCEEIAIYFQEATGTGDGGTEGDDTGTSALGSASEDAVDNR